MHPIARVMPLMTHLNIGALLGLGAGRGGAGHAVGRLDPGPVDAHAAGRGQPPPVLVKPGHAP